VTGARDQLDAAFPDRRRHLLCDGAELGVTLADHQRDGDRQLAEPAPQRLHHAGAQAAQSGREAGGRVAQTVGMGGGRDTRVLAGEQRLRAPLLGERLDADALDPLGQLLVGAAPRLALGRVGEAGAGADEHEPLHQPGLRQRGVERDPAAHRVADQRARAAGQRAHVRGAGRERCGPPLRGQAVAREVGGERAIASAERRDRPPPALPRLREAVQEDDR
jgi:hypothetical protein